MPIGMLLEQTMDHEIETQQCKCCCPFLLQGATNVLSPYPSFSPGEDPWY